MTATQTTYTDTEAVDTLTAEGYRRSDVLAAIDSIIVAGLDLDQPDEGHVLTADEVDVLRGQLTAAPVRTLRYYGTDEVPESPGWTVVTYDAAGVMVAEDIISDERAAELRASGVKDER